MAERCSHPLVIPLPDARAHTGFLWRQTSATMSPMTQTTVTDRRRNMIKTCFMTAKCQLTPHPWISDEHSVSVLYAEKCSKWLTDEKIQWLSGVLRLVPSTPLHCTLALILQVSWTLHRTEIFRDIIYHFVFCWQRSRAASNYLP